MTKIESNKKNINKRIEFVYSFLEDINNLEKIMPDRVVDWQSTSESCYFTIKGTASLGMKIEEKKPSTFIKLINDGKVPFTFNFLMELAELDNENTSVQFIFNADLNPMLKMMAVSPLKNFLNILLENLSETNF